MRVRRSKGSHAAIASDIVSILEHRGKAGSWYLVILDEYRVADPLGLADFLDVRQTHVKLVNERLYEGGRDIVIDMIVTTSDARAARARRRVGGKVPWILMWNLPRRAAEELAGQLEIREEKELLWRLTGGNPRALELIKRDGLKRWIKSEVIGALSESLRPLSGESELWGWISDIAEDPDRLVTYEGPEKPLAEALLGNNIVINTGVAHHMISDMPNKPWVGEYYAYQVPAYHYAIKAAAKRRDLAITPEEVIREAMV